MIRASLGWAALGLLFTVSITACEKKQKVEENPSVKIDLPDPPQFTEAKAQNEDGSLTVTELRRHGKKHENQVATVKGYVTWVYRCPKEIWECRSTKEKLCEPCERPHYYLAENPNDPPEKALWVVDYSRKLRDWESPPPPNPACAPGGATPGGLPVAPPAGAPTAAAPAPIPPVDPKEGELVSVVGKFGYASNSGFRNSRGLIEWCSQTLGAPAPAAPAPTK